MGSHVRLADSGYAQQSAGHLDHALGLAAKPHVAVRQWRRSPRATGVDLGERHYIDLAAIWDFTDNASLRIGINNLFDREPPIVGQEAGPSISGNGGTFPGLYDVLGRYLFIGVTASFL